MFIAPFGLANHAIEIYKQKTRQHGTLSQAMDGTGGANHLAIALASWIALSMIAAVRGIHSAPPL
jgi:hypothetical protein